MKLRIKELREEMRWTQKELAERISNVQRNISNWESGASEPDCETILKLAELFDVSIDELFGREYSPRAASDTDDITELYRMIRRLTPEQAAAMKSLLSAFMV